MIINHLNNFNIKIIKNYLVYIISWSKKLIKEIFKRLFLYIY